jgi:predicted nucleotidyltransferase
MDRRNRSSKNQIPPEGKELEKISKHLVHLFSPQKIILFGSCAAGKADDRSDIDLLVITSFSGRRRRLMVEMDRALASFKKPVDIIIQTAEEYDINRLIPGTIARYAYLEGKVLYDSKTH